VAYGDILHAQGELTLSRRVLEEGLRANLEAADARNIARASTQLAGVALETGDAARATRLLEDALALQRDLGDRWGVPRSLQGLGLAAQVRNDSEAASANFGQALAMFLDVEDRSGVASTLDCLADLALQAGSHERATRLYAAAGVLHEMVDSSALYHTQPHRDKNIDALSSALGTETFADLWAEGRSLTVNEAVEYANTERLPERSH
jgi:tetratricopeptide (TPR) repeat protein